MLNILSTRFIMLVTRHTPQPNFWISSQTIDTPCSYGDLTALANVLRCGCPCRLFLLSLGKFSCVPMTDQSPRYAAEWEPQQCVLLTLPTENTDWAYMLADIHACYAALLRALLQYRANPVLLAPDREYVRRCLGNEIADNVQIVEADYDDTWIRDYGPLTLHADGQRVMADFTFNGWGGKFRAQRDNAVTQRHLSFLGNSRSIPYELEGGSVETDGRGTILTTTRCLCSATRNGGRNKHQVEEELARALGASHVLWLNYGHLEGDDTDGHIDTLARLAPGETIIYTGCDDPRDEHYEELASMKRELLAMRAASGRRFSLVELPLPVAVFDPEDGHRLPATYANYLVTDCAVIVPAYGNERKDRLARLAVGSAFPDRVAVSVDARALLRQHGSIHCATMQISR